MATSGGVLKCVYPYVSLKNGIVHSKPTIFGVPRGHGNPKCCHQPLASAISLQWSVFMYSAFSKIVNSAGPVRVPGSSWANLGPQVFA